MAFQPVANTVLCTANFRGPDARFPSFSVASRNLLAPWDASQQTLISNALRDAIIAAYLPVLSVDFTFVNVTSRDLEAEFGLVIEHATVNMPGTLASPSLPSNVAVRASFIGSPGGPPRRGGIFLLPPAENQIIANMISVGPLAGLQTAAEAIHNSMSSSGPAHVIISRFSGTALVPGPGGQLLRRPVKRPAGLTNTVPTVLVRSRVDSQKKRRPPEG